MLILLQQHKEADAVLRIVSLSRFFDSRRPVIWPFEMKKRYEIQNAPESRLAESLAISVGFPHVSISQVAEGQLYSLAAQGIMDTEKRLLGSLDEQTRRCDRKNTLESSGKLLILGLLIRRLGLLYKRRLHINYIIF